MFVVTFVATLATALEFAIFVGVLASLLVYLNRTTHPSLTRVAPDARTPQRRFAALGPASRTCPQLDILRLDGSLFFGAVEHVRDELEAARRERPEASHVLLVGSGVNFIDIAGCEALVQASRAMRDSGATLYLCNLKPSVHAALERSGFLDEFGRERVWPTKADAIRALYKRFAVPQCAQLHRAHLHRVPHLPARRHAARRRGDHMTRSRHEHVVTNSSPTLAHRPGAASKRGGTCRSRTPIDGTRARARARHERARPRGCDRPRERPRSCAGNRVPAPRRGELVRLYGNALREAQERARHARHARDRASSCRKAWAKCRR